MGFTLRIVHTISPGRYGERVPLDLTVELGATSDMWDKLQFVGDEESLNFFPDEETGTGQEAM